MSFQKSIEGVKQQLDLLEMNSQANAYQARQYIERILKDEFSSFTIEEGELHLNYHPKSPRFNFLIRELDYDELEQSEYCLPSARGISFGHSRTFNGFSVLAYSESYPWTEEDKTTLMSLGKIKTEVDQPIVYESLTCGI